MTAVKQNDSSNFTENAIKYIQKIPKGKVATYGQIAAYAGNVHGARQVVRILHSSSKKHKLPWHRVVNKSGRISLGPDAGYEEQKIRLVKDGVVFGVGDKIDLKKYLCSL